MRPRWKQRSAREDPEFPQAAQDDQGRFLDFHAFRHTRGVWLFEHHNAKRAKCRSYSASAASRWWTVTRRHEYTSSAVIERGPNLAPRDAGGPKIPLADAVGDGKSLAPTWPKGGIEGL